MEELVPSAGPLDGDGAVAGEADAVDVGEGGPGDHGDVVVVEIEAVSDGDLVELLGSEVGERSKLRLEPRVMLLRSPLMSSWVPGD